MSVATVVDGLVFGGVLVSIEPHSVDFMKEKQALQVTIARSNGQLRRLTLVAYDFDTDEETRLHEAYEAGELSSLFGEPVFCSVKASSRKTSDFVNFEVFRIARQSDGAVSADEPF